MLHELFLLLAGHPSPLFTPELSPSFSLVSPSERALLNNLARLGFSHRSLRTSCDIISSSHPSTIARTTAQGIISQLQKFRRKISETENLIVRRDASAVGPYDIIPLAKIVSSFSGWDRILKYMEELANSMLGYNPQIVEEQSKDVKQNVQLIAQRGLNGAKIIDRLRDDIHTGYTSIEKVALELLEVAEMAWLRQVSTWVLYGCLPVFGESDFMIQPKGDEQAPQVSGDELQISDYVLSKNNTPSFISSETAASILFIGRALSQIQSKGGGKFNLSQLSLSSSTTQDGLLLPSHLAQFQVFESPFNPALFHTAVSNVRSSLSRNILQRLLPSQRLVQIIHILREFYLLGRGEFAVGPVTQAEEKERRRWRRVIESGHGTPLSTPVIKEGEVNAVLIRTWASLSSFQSEEDHDDRLEEARDFLYFTLYKPPAQTGSTPRAVLQKKLKSGKVITQPVFNDLLLGVPISLNFHLSWPLELFLTPQDLEIYESLFHYLISIRRAQIRLQSLWQSRRNYAVQGLATTESKERLKKQREALSEVERQQRMVWATASLANFFLESLGVYFQENVIGVAFDELQRIVSPTASILEKSENLDEALKRSLSSIEGNKSKSMGSFSKTTGTNPPSRPRTPNPTLSRYGTQITPITSPSKGRIIANSSPLRQRTAINPIDRGELSSNSDQAPPSTSAANQNTNNTSPEILATAHHQYLTSLVQNTFLSDLQFLYILRKFLMACDAIGTHLRTLAKSNEFLGLDDVRGEPGREGKDAERVCKSVRELLGRLVQRLHEMDEERGREDRPKRKPWRSQMNVGQEIQATDSHKKISNVWMGGALGGARIDKLLMKLDFGSLNLLDSSKSERNDKKVHGKETS